MQNDGPRILAIVPSAFCFGLQNITLAVFGEISKSVPCHFLVTKWNDGEFPRRLRELNIPFTSAWLGMFSRKLDWRNLKMTIECLIKLPSAYFVLARLIGRFKPTCIYLANHHEAILLWPILIFFRSKVICHLHDPPPPIPFQKASYWFWRAAIGRFIFISHSARDRIRRLGPIGDKDTVIWNGVKIRDLSLPRMRTDRFCQQFGWPADSVVVGLTGQMTPTKGHEDFIAAAAVVTRKNPKARFVIGGKGFDEFMSIQRELVAANGLQAVVGFSGWTENVTDFFEAIDLFVLASRHDEGFGLVLAEAGERGLASVATRSGGAAEIIVDGETGVLVEKAKPDDMAMVIEKLVAGQDLRQQMGGRARSRVIEFFDLDQQAAKIKAFLNRS